METETPQKTRKEINILRQKVVISLIKKSQNFIDASLANENGTKIKHLPIEGTSIVQVWLEDDTGSCAIVNVSASGFFHYGPQSPDNNGIPMIRVDTERKRLFIGKDPQILVGILLAQPDDAEDANLPRPRTVHLETVEA